MAGGRCAASPATTPSVSERSGLVNSDLLLPRVALGEAAAIKACIDRFGGLIWSLARRMTHNDAEAEDAVQEIFVEIWQSAHRYDVNIASETAFVAMIARRRLIDRRRKADRRPDEQALPDGVFSNPEPDAPPSEVVEEAGIASAALEKLSAEQQRVLRLSIFQGLSHEKISRSTGLPLGTVKTHARRGLIRIRELLEAEKTLSEPKPEATERSDA
jgi:RNA polymerase sigma factor (sigma-70 family)